MQTASRVALAVSLALTLPATTPAWASPAPTPPPPAPPAVARVAPLADLRVDANRDGVVDVTGATDANDQVATATRGALVLPNIDDDARRCPSPDRVASIAKLAACHDAANTVVDGAADAQDLAPLRTVPNKAIPSGAYATFSIGGRTASAHGRLFLKRGTRWVLLRAKDRVGAAQLRAGVTLGLEASDVVRDARVWSGGFTVTQTVHVGGRTVTDRAAVHVAPLVPQLNSDPVTTLAIVGGGDPSINLTTRQLRAAIARAGSRAAVVDLTGDDRWTQDLGEPMVAAMPVAGRRVQTVHALVLSDQARAGQMALFRLRGPGVGVVWHGEGARDGTFNSTGNVEALPATPAFPYGRVVVGTTRPGDPGYPEGPSSRARRFFASQGTGDPLVLHTGWLTVGHVDEFFHLIPARTPRGWTLAVADPAAAVALLKTIPAPATTPLIGRRGEPSPTVAQALRDPHFLKDNARAAAAIDGNITTLLAATGLPRAEMVRVPVLYTTGLGGEPGPDGPAPLDAAPVGALTSTLPNSVNGVVLNRGTYLAPRVYGPVVGGRDVFAAAVFAAYARVGLRVVEIEDFDAYHRGEGDVHCATNALRAVDPKRALGLR